MWFEDFEPGLVMTSAARTVTEADVVAFAGLSGDYNALHADEPFAARTPFRGRIAHGLLIESIASGLAHQMGIFDGTIQALEEMVIRWRRPVKPGDTVHLRLEVASRDGDPAPRRGRVRLAATVINHRGELCVDGEWTTVMLRDRRRDPSDGQGEDG